MGHGDLVDKTCLGRVQQEQDTVLQKLWMERPTTHSQVKVPKGLSFPSALYSHGMWQAQPNATGRGPVSAAHC